MSNNEDCPTCNGYIFNAKTGSLVKTRTTVGMICPDCGHNYMEDE